MYMISLEILKLVFTITLMTVQEKLSGVIRLLVVQETSGLSILGSYAMSLIDTVSVMPESMQEEKAKLSAIYKELIDSMLKYQTENGMWYQVVNLGGIPGNYLETSGSSIFAYAIMKSVRMGILDESYFQYGEKAFNGVCEKYLSEKDGELQLDGICLVAGLGPEDNKRRDGTFGYYMSEPIVSNDAKGVGPLVLAYIEILYKEKAGK